MTNNQAKQLYSKGSELMSLGKLSEALNYFREAIEADPSCIEAHIELGFLLGTLEKYGEAIKVFDQALMVEDNFPCFFGKGLAHFFLEEYEKSLEAFMDAQEIGENEDLWYYLGNLHLCYSKNCEGAVNCFEIAISMDENFIEAWNDCGVAYSIMEEDENALEYFKEALKIDSNYISAIYNAGATLADMGRYEEALEYLDKILEIEPDNFKALFYKGNVLYFMENEEKSLKYFIKALKKDPNQPDLWNYVGYIQNSLGQNYEAVESFNKAISLRSDDENNYLSLGTVYMDIGDSKMASECFKKVLEIDPENEEAQFYMEKID